MNNHKNFKLPRWIPGVLISLVAVYFLTRFVDPLVFVQSFRGIRWFDILVFLALFITSLVVRAAAWRFLLVDVSYKDAFLIINEGYLFNNLIPRSGEIARTILASSVSSLSVMQVAVSILFERALDVIIAAGMFLVTLPLAVSLTWIQPIAIVLLASLFAIIVAMLLIAANAQKLKIRVTAIRSENRFIKKFVLGGLSRVVEALEMMNRPGEIALAVLLIAATWVVWTVMLFYGIRVIVPGAPFWWSVFAEGVLALGIAIPSAPASLGVYEGTMVAALAVFEIQAEQALSLAVTLHFLQILITSMIGIYGLIAQGHSISGMVEKIRTKIKSSKGEDQIKAS